MPTPATRRRTSLGALSAVMALAITACASGGPRPDPDWSEKRIIVKTLYGASMSRVDSAGVRALIDLGYTVARHDSGDSGWRLHAAPRDTWDDCVRAEIRAASHHPVVELFLATRREGDSTAAIVGAITRLRVPDVVVEGKRVNAHVVVKMCAIAAVVARMDTLLDAPGRLAAADDSAERAGAAESAAAYDHLVSQLRSGDTLADYTALRMAYTKTAYYRPYPVRWQGNHAMFAALERKHFAVVRQLADSILSTDYADADAHLGAMAAAFNLGDSARGHFHGAVYRGLISSIGTQSGRTLDSAIVVITLQEEYALLRARGLERKWVVFLQCGRALCERMQVIDRKGRTESTLYFDISIPQAWGAKHLQE